MARMGMDVEAVERVGRDLQAQAGQLAELVGGIDRLVTGLRATWDGPDARRFVDEWWPQHKAALTMARERVHGLGQSALNNASEQREVSGGASGGGVIGGGAGLGPGDWQPIPEHGMVFPESPFRSVDQPSEAAPAFRAWADGAIGRGMDVDHRDGNQCVDTVRDYVQTVFGRDSYGLIAGGGDAMAVYSKASADHFEHLPSSITPQAGDILCQGPNQYSSVGHVAVVERVDAQGIHVIQQNGNDPTGVAYRGVIRSGEPSIQGFLRPRL